uniref:Uncharacterized protein n=1 Tax=Klebsiella pneumoniae TaxID=573 RepID=A0A8B0ST78_KLEPN|nr:hypothetical protein [Klebsiella pneumoniae]
MARRLDSAAGREPKVSSAGVLLKPLRVKKRHHSRKKKRKQTDSREQAGNVKMQAGENMFFSCRRKEAMINRRHTRRGVRNGAYFSFLNCATLYQIEAGKRKTVIRDTKFVTRLFSPSASAL